MHLLAQLLRFLGKVQFTMILLLAGIVAMAAGTVIEARDGADAARAAVYGTLAFDGFLVLIAVNLIVAVVNRIPIKRHQWAFVVTHASIVLLLTGALISRTAGYEGILAVAEKQTARHLDLRTAELAVEWGAGRSVTVPLGQVPRTGPIDLGDPTAPDLRLAAVAHDSEFRVSLGEGAPADGPGVELAFDGKGWHKEEWLIGAHRFFRRKDLGTVEVELLVAPDAAVLDEWRAPREDLATTLTVHAAAGTDSLELTLPADLDVPKRLGDCDVTATGFFPRARVGDDDVRDDPAAPVNPAAVVRIAAHGRAEVHTVFSQFPQFNVVKGRVGEPLVGAVALQASGAGEKPLVRILVDPKAENHWVQLAVAQRRGQAWPLQIGRPVVLGDLGIDVTLRRARPHARPEVELRRARERGTGTRWIKVETLAGGEAVSGWVQHGARHVLRTAAQELAITYRPARIELPFTVTLDEFDVAYHPGSRKPAQYTSRVSVERDGAVTAAAVAMNRPLDVSGHRVFQSSFRRGEGGQPDTTFLSVSYDPGVPLVYVSFVLLIFGVTWYLRSHAPRREAEQASGAPAPAAATAPVAAGHATGIAALPILLCAATLAPAASAQAPPDVPVEATRGLAIQAGGRVKPLETRARELILSITGKRGIDGYGPLHFLWGFHFAPDRLRAQPWIRVDSDDLKAALGVAADRRRVSFDALFDNQRFRELVEAAKQRADDTSSLDDAALEVYGKLEWIAGIMDGSALRLFPTTHGTWASIADLRADGSGMSQQILAALAGMSNSYREADGPAFARHAGELTALIRTSGGAACPAPGVIGRELFYHDLNAYGWAWVAYLLAVAPLLLFQRSSRRALARSGVGLLGLGWLLHTTGLLLRWVIAGRAPVSDMYESLVFMSWGVVGIGLVLEVCYRGRVFSLAAAVTGAISLMFAEFLPLDSAINPLVPVLAHTAWLSIHVMTIMLSYSAFVLAMALGHIVIFIQIKQPGKTDTLRYLASLLYRTIQIGLVFLCAGIAFGAIWANESWGRYWGWDPKETWSLITFFVYLAVVHARFAGWLHNFGLAVCSILGFLSVLMTYYGVNFILAAGLHSYGFSSGGTAALIAYLAAEAAVVTWAAVRHRAAIAAHRTGQQATT